MKKSKLFILLGTVFSLAACGGDVKGIRGASILREPSKTGTSYDYRENDYLEFKRKLCDFSTKFSESFLKNKFKDNENILSSPFSLEMCLGLAVCSSSGKTRQELLDTLEFDFTTFNKYYKRLYVEHNLSKLNDENDLMFQIMCSNSIWIDNDIKLLDSGLDALRDDYSCYSYETDFSSKDASKAIGEFINIQSKGLLKPTLDFDPRTLFVLMNTLYLKDIWNVFGEDINYSNDPNHYFVNSNKVKSSKKLLRGYYEIGKAIMTEDYSSFYTSTLNGFEIYFIKPNDGKDLKTVFNKDAMDYVLGNNYVLVDDEKKEEYYTRAIFPEFNASCDTDLTSILMHDFNITSLFDSENCKFSNLTDEAVFCKEVRQIAKLDVNKKGIEGAAVTYMTSNGTAAPDEKYTKVYEDFVVDKEFGFILTYCDSVLFSGVINNIDK
ncbi:MAG: hypothetical protein K6E21_02395 [Bacilli bacterium]|nr:hypothetical protein [Bacilli bacterium]